LYCVICYEADIIAASRKRKPWPVKRYVAYHGENTERPLADYRVGELFLAFDACMAAEYGAPVYEVVIGAKSPLEIRTASHFMECWIASGANEGGSPFHPNMTSRFAAWARDLGYDVIVLDATAFAGELGFQEVAGRFGEPQLIVLNPDSVLGFKAVSGA
jgi:hypothetical protein